ncbi:hypothetical protein BDY24DRAFT_428296 [Mrakia frigida]|uniref:HECT-type E3 ubiquitin-protein ligase n=1 Tax=Mrakia frigida TaxID=29902 RepID=UPI003FCC181D
MAKTPAMLRKLLVVKFHGEDGDDAGGLSKEFFFLLSQELFNPEYGLFLRGTEASNYNLQINADSGTVDPEHHLQHFKLFGRCVALSIFHHRLIDVQFAPTFYQAMLGQKITLGDLKAVDEPLWKSLTWTLNNDIEGVLDDETFSYIEESMFGEQIAIDIVPGGSRISLTNANKSRYVDAMVEHKTLGRTKDQFKSFMDGIDEIVHRDHFTVFSASELEALISGSSQLDVADWRKHTELENYTVHDPQIKWLWTVVENWDDAMRSRFLQFATGAARIPLTGFRDLRGGGESRLFKVTRVGAPTALPAAHSCFNRVDLPPYTSMAILEQKLTMA